MVVVGAGTAGAAAALACARAGLRTACVDRRDLAEAGARWVNGVVASAFDDAEIPRPAGEERRGGGHAFHIVSGWGPKRIVIREHDVLEVDMRLLVERLQRLAREAGATFTGGVRIGAFDGRALETSEGRLSARWFVDATGLAGARLLEQPKVLRGDLCAAAQEVRAVRDPVAARAFFADNDVAPGDTLCFTGISGGYSIVNVRLDGDHVSILTGGIPAGGHKSGRELVDDFVREQPWIGEVIFGGARPIPLRRPLDRLASDNVALIGDAACQVFSAHGSGIGAGMVAARLLADALASDAGPHAYAHAWQRRYGGLFAAYDLFRRFSETLGPAELDVLMDSGLLDETTARAGLEQRFPKLVATSLPGKVGGLWKARRVAGAFARLGARMASAMALYARYPADPAGVPAWSARAERLLDG